MYIVNSANPETTSDKKRNTTPQHPDIEYLKYIVDSISIPRHYVVEHQNNTSVFRWIKNEFETLGMNVAIQGKFNNIIASYGEIDSEFSVIVGAHYDSVPNSPGADDNASAIAGLLALAKKLRATQHHSIGFIAFNREEDGLLGSTEYVNSLTEQQKKNITCAHILEMIGYASNKPGTQSLPPDLPINIGDKGDFIAILANKKSNNLISKIIDTADQHTPSLPVKCLKVFLGIEKMFPHLLRSDHAPFWKSNIPSLMWTDTSEFRNPNYHRFSDTPETLNYAFLYSVVELLRYSILQQVNITADEPSGTSNG
jgi:Zn-dependent M28 family amino/carboxypeptidase